MLRRGLRLPTEDEKLRCGDGGSTFRDEGEVAYDLRRGVIVRETVRAAVLCILIKTNKIYGSWRGELSVKRGGVGGKERVSGIVPRKFGFFLTSNSPPFTRDTSRSFFSIPCLSATFLGPYPPFTHTGRLFNQSIDHHSHNSHQQPLCHCILTPRNSFIAQQTLLRNIRVCFRV